MISGFVKEDLTVVLDLEERTIVLPLGNRAQVAVDWLRLWPSLDGGFMGDGVTGARVLHLLLLFSIEVFIYPTEFFYKKFHMSQGCQRVSWQAHLQGCVLLIWVSHPALAACTEYTVIAPGPDVLFEAMLHGASRLELARDYYGTRGNVDMVVSKETILDHRLFIISVGNIRLFRLHTFILGGGSTVKLCGIANVPVAEMVAKLLAVNTPFVVCWVGGLVVCCWMVHVRLIGINLANEGHVFLSPLSNDGVDLAFPISISDVCNGLLARPCFMGLICAVPAPQDTLVLGFDVLLESNAELFHLLALVEVVSPVSIMFAPDANLAMGLVEHFKALFRIPVEWTVERAMIDVATGAPLILVHLLCHAIPSFMTKQAAVLADLLLLVAVLTVLLVFLVNLVVLVLLSILRGRSAFVGAMVSPTTITAGLLPTTVVIVVVVVVTVLVISVAIITATVTPASKVAAAAAAAAATMSLVLAHRSCMVLDISKQLSQELLLRILVSLITLSQGR